MVTLSYVIRELRVEDAGIYECHAFNSVESENSSMRTVPFDVIPGLLVF